MSLLYTDRSKDDLEISFSWYEKQRRGLGFEFLDCIEVAINRIMQFPEMYKKCHENFRGCVVRRFPFTIFYTIENSDIIIHSIFNNKQDPVRLPKQII